MVTIPKTKKRITPLNEDTEIPSPELNWLMIVSKESIPISKYTKMLIFLMPESLALQNWI
jgi:hypothetical protein